MLKVMQKYFPEKICGENPIAQFQRAAGIIANDSVYNSSDHSSKYLKSKDKLNFFLLNLH